MVEVEDFGKITHHFRGINGIYIKLVKRNQKITTCNNRLDFETHGFCPIITVCPWISPNTVPPNLHFLKDRKGKKLLNS